MKIAFVLINANRFEGTSRAVVEVAERLAVDNEVHLFARSAVDVDLKHIRWHRVASPSWPDVAEFEVFRQTVDRTLSAQEFDIIHAAGCVCADADVFAIQTVHPKKMEATGGPERNQGASAPRRFTRWLYDVRVLQAERQSYTAAGPRGVKGYLPVSSGTERELRECYRLDDAVTDVIPNAADLEMFRPQTDSRLRDAVRTELGIPTASPVALFAGGEWRRKGLRHAVEALAVATTPDLRLVVAGTDPQAADYRELAEQRGVADRVHWLGFRSDIDRLYAAADVFLFPSSYEAFSLASIEAAAAGLPVLMCDVSGAHELVGDGKGGQIVPRNAAGIADAMTRFFDDETLRERWAREAREKVERLFNWDHVSAQTLAFYERLLQTRNRVHAESDRRSA